MPPPASVAGGRQAARRRIAERSPGSASGAATYLNTGGVQPPLRRPDRWNLIADPDSRGPDAVWKRAARVIRPFAQARLTSKPPRAQLGDRTVGPRRQRRQQDDLAGMTLHQHLRDGGGHAEVAVDLKRRMRAEQVGVHTPPCVLMPSTGSRSVEVAEDAACAIAIRQTRPERRLPCHRPPGSFVAASLEREPGCLEPLRRVTRNCRPGCRPNKCDTCRCFGSTSGNGSAHSIRRPSGPTAASAVDRVAHLTHERIVDLQNRRCLEHVGEEIPDDFDPSSAPC